MFRAILLSAVLVLAASTAASAAPILLDVQGESGTVTQAGYTALTPGHKFYSTPTTELTLSDGVTVGWLNSTNVTWNNKTDDKFPPSIPPSDLLRDFGNFGAVGRQLQLRNLAPGLYDLTLWAVDVEWKDKSTEFRIDQDNDGTFEMTTVIDARALAEITKTVQVNVSQDGVLTIHVHKDPAKGSGGVLNGLDLVAVPEPATLFVLLGGAGLAIVRRRR